MSKPNKLERSILNKGLEELKNNSNSEYKTKEPKTWLPIDYVSYMYNSGVAEFYWKYFNCIFDDGNEKGVSYGFRIPSLVKSRTSALETKFFMHKCKVHKGEKHSELINDINYPTATWKCPLSDKKDGYSQLTIRHTKPNSYIPITFSTDKEKGIIDILRWGYGARTWYTEFGIIKNEYRGMTIFPEHYIDVNLIEQANRIKNITLVIDFDTKRDEKGNRRDIMQEGDKILENAQKIINVVTDYLYTKGVTDFEWWFSGNGLYLLIHHDEISIPTSGDNKGGLKGLNNRQYINNVFYRWNKFKDNVMKMLGKEGNELKHDKIMYIGVDNTTQYLRYFQKAPYSLHRSKDRLTLPLTGMFGDNEKIDLLSGKWRHYIDPRNMTRKFVNRMKIDI